MGGVLGLSLALAALGSTSGLAAHTEPAAHASADLGAAHPQGCAPEASYGVVGGTASQVGISSDIYSPWVQPGAKATLSGSYTATSSWGASAQIGISASFAVASAHATVGGSYSSSSSSTTTFSASYHVQNNGDGYGRIMIYNEGVRYEAYRDLLTDACTVSTSYAWVDVPNSSPASLWGLQRQFGPSSGVTTPWS